MATPQRKTKQPIVSLSLPLNNVVQPLDTRCDAAHKHTKQTIL